MKCISLLLFQIPEVCPFKATSPAFLDTFLVDVRDVVFVSTLCFGNGLWMLPKSFSSCLEWVFWKKAQRGAQV